MSTEHTLLAGIGSALSLAGSITQAVGGPRLLLAKLGWDLPAGVEDIGLAGLDLARVGTQLDAWAELAGDPDAAVTDQAVALAELADAVIDVLGELRDLRLQAPADYLARTNIKDEFLTRMLDLYLLQSTAVASRQVFDVAVLLGWFELERLDADPAKFQVKHIRHRVHWDRVPKLFTDLAGLLRETYGWGSAAFDPDVLVARVGAVLQHISADVRQRRLPPMVLSRMQAGPAPPVQPPLQLFLPLLGSSGPVGGETGITVFGLPPTAAGAAGAVDGGIGIAPYAEGAASLRLPLTTTLSLGISAQADLGSGIALLLRPETEPVLRTNLNRPQAGTASAGAELKLDLTFAAPKSAPRIALLTVGESTIEATSVSIAAGASVEGAQTDAILRLQIQAGKLTLKPGLAFLETDGLVVDADVDLSWSHRHGVRLDGRAELKTSVAIGRKLGPVTIGALRVGLATTGDAVALSAGLDVVVSIGPVKLGVEGVGLRVALTPGPGSLGSADLTLRPVPPTGVGIEVDAAAVVGGGFLRFEPDKHQYSGVLQLEIAEKISVKAIGLLSTRLPDGSKGYSLVLIIVAEGFTPIQLGFGFTLTGIGGLIAIHRTFDEDVLRAGLKSHTLDSVLFPRDPARNAPQILSNLNRVFPASRGSHLFGPMLQLGWGTPALITAELAVVLELGKRLRLLVLAQITAILPRRDNDLVRLQLDAVGVIDFDQGTAALDAALYDSRLLRKFALTGEMALRMQWRSSPSFALAVGGLHPAFNPPPKFPKLERIAIALAAGDNPRLRCEAYFAITSNTVQFGARAELFASAAGFSVLGQVGFDTLIQFDPFAFLAEFDAQVQLKRGSTNLFKVRVEGSLAGPRPLVVKAKATFEILWWDVSVRVDKTLVSGAQPPRPEPLAVLPRLEAALKDPANWVAQLPAGQRQWVTLRPQAGAAGEVLLHPLGTLRVTQKVVPLNVDISRFGRAPPAGTRRFTITSVSLGGDPQATDKVKDFFAPAEFFDMSDDQKLSRPSFEQMDAGIRFGAEQFAFSTEARDRLEVKALEFETWILDQEELRRPEPADATNPKSLYRLSALALAKQARYGAAGESELRRTGAAKYRSLGVGKYQLAKASWSVVAEDDLTLQPLPGVQAGQAVTYTEALQALEPLRRQAPSRPLQILRRSELSEG